jgi:predicted RNase H-like HicB family nuclease
MSGRTAILKSVSRAVGGSGRLEAARPSLEEANEGLPHMNVSYSDEDGAYIADIPDLESCSAFGRTPEEAVAEVEKAKEAWLRSAREEGKPIPEPRYKPAVR